MHGADKIEDHISGPRSEVDNRRDQGQRPPNKWLRELICNRGRGYTGTELFLIDIISVYSDDIKMRILIYLSRNREPSSIRKIARNLRCTHKSIIKHIEPLKAMGLVEEYYSQSNLKLYLLSDRLKEVRSILERFEY